MSFETDMHCDGCGETIFRCSHRNTAPKWLMIKIAREQGWSIGKYHLCPDCKKKRNKLIKDGMLT